jgi:hypothetical protein
LAFLLQFLNSARISSRLISIEFLGKSPLAQPFNTFRQKSLSGFGIASG